MKKSSIITAFLAVFMMVVPSQMSAQEEIGEDQLSNGFQKFNVIEDFTDNGFQWFRDAQLLCAGNQEKRPTAEGRSQGENAMTIGWGGIGTLWQRPALICYMLHLAFYDS